MFILVIPFRDNKLLFFVQSVKFEPSAASQWSCIGSREAVRIIECNNNNNNNNNNAIYIAQIRTQQQMGVEYL